MIIEGLGLLGIIAIGGGVAVNFTTDSAAMEVQPSADLALAHAQVIAGVDLVSLNLGQLSVFMLCFTLVGEPRRVPPLAHLPLPCGTKYCAYL